MKPPDEHLGDGLYISHDGYQYWFAVNHHKNHVAAMDPHALMSLVRYLVTHDPLARSRMREELEYHDRNKPDTVLQENEEGEKANPEG